jgi:phospholipase C
MNAITGNIKHVVVLMFENRSFDHVFGAFPGANGVLAEDGGLKPECYNLPDPTQSSGGSNQRVVPLEIEPDYDLTYNYNHDFGDGMMPELFGPGTTGWEAGQAINAPPVTHPQTNSGFFYTNGKSRDAMSYYRHGSLKVLHTLASEFVLCDNWFCDVPADTLLNRYFMHTAQTAGVFTDAQWGDIGIDVDTIFNQVTQQGSSWKMYSAWAVKPDGQPVPNPLLDSRFLNRIEHNQNTNLPVTCFAAAAAAGTLPLYSFLMCWAPSGFVDFSMHPDSNIRPGENYLAAVYNCLRNSPSWNDTLLIVTFDENGGMYDHVAPPKATAPYQKVYHYGPSGNPSLYAFDYGLLGPRIPVILISPWLRKGIAKAQYQNTSILRLIQNLIGAAPLTGRDKDAPTLDSLFNEFGLSQPRSDCLLSMPTYPGFPYADGDLSQTLVQPVGTRVAPPRYMAKLERIYGVSLA